MIQIEREYDEIDGNRNKESKSLRMICSTTLQQIQCRKKKKIRNKTKLRKRYIHFHSSASIIHLCMT